jgi:hypothetical protein
MAGDGFAKGASVPAFREAAAVCRAGSGAGAGGLPPILALTVFACYVQPCLGTPVDPMPGTADADGADREIRALPGKRAASNRRWTHARTLARSAATAALPGDGYDRRCPRDRRQQNKKCHRMVARGASMSGRQIAMTARLEKPWCRRVGYRVIPFALLFLPLSLRGADYLDSIQVEAQKLDGEAGVEAPAAVSDGPRVDFEHQLEQRYGGTYLFYKKLPEKSQEEVFLEYRAGASIEGVRKTIMNRFLHNR